MLEPLESNKLSTEENTQYPEKSLALGSVLMGNAYFVAGVAIPSIAALGALVVCLGTPNKTTEWIKPLKKMPSESVLDSFGNAMLDLGNLAFCLSLMPILALNVARSFLIGMDYLKHSKECYEQSYLFPDFELLESIENP